MSLLIFGVIACGPEQRYGDKKILRFNVAGGITSLDPAFSRSLDNVNACRQLFDGLLDLSSDLRLKPALAKSWQVLDSGRLYRFQLRQDVFFHQSDLFANRNEAKLTAEDFVFSFNRLIDPDLLSPGKWVMNKVDRLADGQLNIKAINDSTLEIRLKEPFPPFLGILSMQYCSVVPRELEDRTDYDFQRKPIGTGAFQFKYWKENGKLILLKNPHYYQTDHSGNPLPYIDAVSISFIRDQEVVFLKFLKGELDFISGLNGSYKDELLQPNGALNEEYKDQLRLLKLPYLNTEYLGFQLDSTAYPDWQHDLHLRKAINFAIDKEKMLRYLRNGIGHPAHSGMLPKGVLGYQEDADYGYRYNPDSANYHFQKFMEKQTANTESIELILGTTSEYLDICEYVQHQLAEIGLKVKIEVNQAATNNEMIAFGKIPFFRKSWIADYPDAENYLSLFISSNFSPDGPNYTHFHSREYDSLYRSSMQIDSLEDRLNNYRKMDSLIMANAAVLPLFYDQQIHFVSPRISALEVNPMSHLMLKYAKKGTPTK